MTHRERVFATLHHQEPDKVPYDFSATNVTGIALQAYQRLVSQLGLHDEQLIPWDLIQQLAKPSEQVLTMLNTEFRGLLPVYYANIPLHRPDETPAFKTANGVTHYVDEWKTVYRFREGKDLYYQRVSNTLPESNMSAEQIDSFPMPDGDKWWRYEGMKEKAAEFQNNDKVVLVRSVCAGLCEMASRIRGMDNFLVDLALNEASAKKLVERIMAVKLSYWRKLLRTMGNYVDIIVEADDYGTQESLLLSPEMFRNIFKPSWQALFMEIKKLAPDVKIFFHSCGAVRPLIPDFIEMGVDILNPVHSRAKGMDPRQLKTDFGKDISFWGGGIDTQQMLPLGSKEAIADEVKRNIDILAPGGGWVFSTIHNVQADVAPENFLAMHKTCMDYR